MGEHFPMAEWGRWWLYSWIHGGRAASRADSELLHIHVQQIPGMVVLVATDRLAGGPVHMGEPVEPAADQHRVHRRGRQAQPVGDLDRAEPLLPPQVHDLPDGRGRGPVFQDTS